MAHEFNLITEPWIKVLRDSEVMEVSLEDALINAHNYDSLAGELPTQDLSVLRLLLAVLHCSLENMKVNAECEEDIPFIKWESIWQEGCFDAQLIKEYLNSKKDRFWLFDEVHPFYQVAETDEKVSKSVSLAKFNGQLSESDNKTRLFPFISGVTKDKMSYSEAARWLLYANSWADSSSCKSYVDKEKNKDLFENGTKYGWLGKLGNINAVGDNLFETLMLNLTFLRADGNKWGKEKPVWDREITYSSVYGENIPDNQSELLTLINRYMYLVREGPFVTGVKISRKCVLSQKNCLCEEMTLWKNDDKGDYLPRQHDCSKQVWREYSAFMTCESNCSPGIIHWINSLIDLDIIPNDKIIRFNLCGVAYDASGGSIVDMSSDSISVHLSLLSVLGNAWNERIIKELEKVEMVANAIGKLREQLLSSRMNPSNEQGAKEKRRKLLSQARERFYSLADLPFRTWLEAINPNDGSKTIDEVCLEWESIIKRISHRLAGELVDEAGPSAVSGRAINSEAGKKEHFSAPEALNIFYGRINSIYGKETKNGI